MDTCRDIKSIILNYLPLDDVKKFEKLGIISNDILKNGNYYEDIIFQNINKKSAYDIANSISMKDTSFILTKN